MTQFCVFLFCLSVCCESLYISPEWHHLFQSMLIQVHSYIDYSWKCNQYCDTFLYNLILLFLSLSLSLTLIKGFKLILARNCKLNEPLGRIFCYRTLPYWLICENASPNLLSPSFSLSDGPHLIALIIVIGQWYTLLFLSHYFSLYLCYSGRGL